MRLRTQALLAMVAVMSAAGLASCSGASSPASSKDGGGATDAGNPRDSGRGHDTGVDAGLESGAVAEASAADASQPGDAAIAACTAVATAQCGTRSQCYASTISALYGDGGDCIARLSTACENRLAATGTTNSPARVSACAMGYATETCTAFLDNQPPVSCPSAVGSVTDGGGCWTSDQCATGYCGIPLGVACGSCGPEPKPGASCVNLTTCGSGAVCSAGLCAIPVTAVSGACSPTQPCASGLSCVTAKDAGMGTCQTAGTTVGAACDSNLQNGPGCGPGLSCVFSKTNPEYDTCQAAPQNKPGQVCGASAGIDRVCVDLSTCHKEDGGARCVARAGDGEPCNTVLGPECIDPSHCIGMSIDGGATGTCVFPQQTECPSGG